jgi:hypothetical protein
MRCAIKDLKKVSLILSDDSIYIPVNGEPCKNEDRENIAEDILNNKKIYVLMPDEFSVFIFFPHSEELYVGHSAILPGGRGKSGIKLCKAAVQWMFDNTECIKIFGLTPVYLKHVIIFNKLVGFEQEGLLTDSCIKDGILYDQILFGLSKQRSKSWDGEQRQ